MTEAAPMTTPRLDDDTPATLDEIAARIRRALLEVGSIREVGRDADIDLLQAEQSLQNALRKIRAA